MARSLPLLAMAALLSSARSLALEAPDCAALVWSDAHGHYHCIDDGRYDPVEYDGPHLVSAPRVYVGLSVHPYPLRWGGYGGYWGWYRPAPRFYAPLRHYHGWYRHHGPYR